MIITNSMVNHQAESGYLIEHCVQFQTKIRANLFFLRGGGKEKNNQRQDWLFLQSLRLQNDCLVS